MQAIVATLAGPRQDSLASRPIVDEEGAKNGQLAFGGGSVFGRIWSLLDHRLGH